MKTITVYTPSELKELDTESFERAHEWYKSTNDEIPWSEEIIDSLKAVFEHSGINLRDYSIDAYGYSWVKFDMESGTNELTGQRALAWLENNLLDQFRYKWGIRYIKERVWMSEHVKNPSRSNGAFIHQAGQLKDCPFTGVCFDEDMIESLLKSIKAGDTLGEAYENLASVASKLFQAEIDGANSEEAFLEQEHLYFDEDGHRVR